MATSAQRLALVRAAIDAILVGGQAVRFNSGSGDRQVTLADLGELRRLEQAYKSEVAAESRAASGRSRITYVVPQ